MIGSTISHYQIIEKLGEGGMGVVYKAHDTKLDRDVALKFLLRHLIINESDRIRFINEARTASQINHPNVCTIYDLKEEDDQQFIVMEYVDGVTLREKIQNTIRLGESPSQVKDVITYAIQIAEAIKAAHDRGIIHRDIKPGNIMINSKNQIKVMDFGLAKLKGISKLTRTSSTVGTIAYMAPEIIKGGVGDTRSDIFSFGLVIYEMLTSNLPFSGNYDAAIMFSIVNENPTLFEVYRSDVPIELQQIVYRTLEKLPDQRYQKIDEILDNLRGSTIIGAHPSSRIKRLILSIRGNHRYAMIFISIILILSIVVGYFSMFEQNKKSGKIRIAVLPLLNLNKTQENEPYTDGLAESMITNLTRVKNVEVIARSSTIVFKGKTISMKQIAKQLDADYLLEGSLLRHGEYCRISMRLVRGENESYLWSKQYDINWDQIFRFEREVSTSILDELNIKLAGGDEDIIRKSPTRDSEAYRLYLEGRNKFWKSTKESYLKAIDYYKKAIEIDPMYALAYAGIAEVYYEMSSAYIPSRDAMPKVKAASEKAIALDSNCAEAYTTLALYHGNYEWNWDEAMKYFMKAITTNPNCAIAHHKYAIVLAMHGKLNRAMEEISLALTLDPLSRVIQTNKIWFYHLERKYEKAVQEMKVHLQYEPDDLADHHTLHQSLRELKMYEEALKELDYAYRLSGYQKAFLAYKSLLFSLMKKNIEAKQYLDSLHLSEKNELFFPYILAIPYIGLKNYDLAFKYLNKAVEERDEAMLLIKVDPLYDPIRSDPRFISLLKKMGLEK